MMISRITVHDRRRHHDMMVIMVKLDTEEPKSNKTSATRSASEICAGPRVVAYVSTM